MIDSVIVAHLGSNKRIVVPEFGAFIRKDTSGEVVFVEFLKKDDGVLTSLLESGYGLNRAEATEAVLKYVNSVRSRCANGGSYIIKGLGSIHVDENSAFVLAYDPLVKTQPIDSPKQTDSIIAKSSATDTPIQSTAAIATELKDTNSNVAEPLDSDKPFQPNQISVNSIQKSDPSDVVDDAPLDVSGLQYQKPAKPDIHVRQKKRKADLIMLIAIAAAALAILAMIYGVRSNSTPEIIIPAPAADTVQTVPGQ